MSDFKDLHAKATQGGLSRRGFATGSAVLGASTVLASGLIVPASAATEEKPKKGGTLRLGLAGGATTDSIDVTSYNDSVMIATSHALFNSLVEWSQEGKPVPELATAFEPRNGAVDWIYFDSGRNVETRLLECQR